MDSRAGVDALDVLPQQRIRLLSLGTPARRLGSMPTELSQPFYILLCTLVYVHVRRPFNKRIILTFVSVNLLLHLFNEAEFWSTI